MVQMSGSDWENQPSGGQTTDETLFNTPTETGYGPFNAKVWNVLGSMDPYGLPKITVVHTTLVNGKVGLALQIGSQWHVWETTSVSKIQSFYKRLKSIYNYKDVMF